MPLTTAYTQKTINHFMRGVSETSTTSYLSLSSTMPTITGSNVAELFGITRQAIGFVAPTSSTSNAADITFTNSSGTIWTVAALCIFDAQTGGTLQAYSAISATVLLDQIYRVFASDLTFGLT